MRKFVLICSVSLLTLLSNETNAQTDTITATYKGTILSDTSSASCYSGGCTYILPVVLPPAFTVTDILCSFWFRPLGICIIDSGGWYISLDSCSTSCITCPHAPEFCPTSNKSIYNDVKSCVPGPTCRADTLMFALHFWRRPGTGGNGCNFSCIIGMDSTYSISVVGTRDTCPQNVIEQEFPSTLKIYPNPANTEIAFHGSFLHLNETASVSIINIVGEAQLQKKIRLINGEVISVKELPGGMYFVEVTDGGERYIGRFVKQ